MRASLVLFLWLVSWSPAAEFAPPQAGPKVAAASDEGELAIKKFRVPAGFKVELFAAEPLLANPVSFAIDEKGRFYVAETFRHSDGVLDIRGHMDWLDDDLAARSVEDRIALIRKHLGQRANDLAIETDRVRLIEDRDGDGRADQATVFADGFTSLPTGIGAGVLARKGSVWYANLPDLWHLRDTNADGVADLRQSLHYGYGVHIGFLGHDLHGLTFGPDGKIYFSIGDRGLHIKTEGRSLEYQDTGTVLRCNPDGSELEVFALGLRNPQELVFDQYGNLWTGDNNSDGGDKARWVYLVEGGDSGWRIGYQFIRSNPPRGPWNAEKMWHPQFEGQPAFLVPPITNIANGPSGVAYYPGSGFSDRYQEHFFLTDFHGGAGSGIHSFAVRPKGASFEMTDQHQFIWEILPTDVDFGPDGALYWTDWVKGWSKTGKGRIYRLTDTRAPASPPNQESVRRLIETGMDRRSAQEVAGLLAHPHQRVRQEAQFSLADRGISSAQIFADIASTSSNRLARLHAIWGLHQLSAKRPDILAPLFPLLADQDAEVRAQTARVLADRRIANVFDKLVALLDDPSPRVQFFAALGLGKLKRKEAVPPLLELARRNGDRDPYLRHAAMMGLTGSAEAAQLLDASTDRSPSVRMAVLLALRRLERADISRFLRDKEPALILEAARAINDVPINGAMPDLAQLITGPNWSVPLFKRVLNANFRLGAETNATLLAEFASNPQAPDELRIEALDELSDWPKPAGRDRVMGLWRPLPSRSSAVVSNALRPRLDVVLQTAPEAVQIAAANTAAQLGLADAAPALYAVVKNKEARGTARRASLKALARLKDSRLNEAIQSGLNDSDVTLRQEAVRLQAEFKPSNAAEELERILDNGTLAEKQNAFATLSSVDVAGGDQVLARWLDRLLATNVPPELVLDVLEAARKRTNAQTELQLRQYEGRRSKSDPMGAYRELLSGGDPAEGKKTFIERPEAACIRCHKINGEGGEVGPDLTGIGARQTKEYILESIIHPNAKIAPGFENLLVMLKSGTVYAGLLKSENEKELVINSPEDGLITVPKSDLKSREPGLSAMPDGIETILSKPDLRDLVEYLSSSK